MIRNTLSLINAHPAAARRAAIYAAACAAPCAALCWGAVALVWLAVR